MLSTVNNAKTFKHARFHLTCRGVGQSPLLGARGDAVLQGLEELLGDVVDQGLRSPWWGDTSIGR